MKLSIIIVNYNVSNLLKEAINSLRNACIEFEYEIIVIDNNSKDDSKEMIKREFPSVFLIENIINVGFSKANNQGIAISSGEYLLVINPDTVTEKTTISKVIDFMDSRLDVGGLTVKMANGKGKYLKESKRGLPTPWASFNKLVGLSKVFPKSKIFNQYYAGHINENENSEIDILPGAFMFLRKQAIDIIGGFDEDFFMYGEDIDLSYRLKLAGFKNYYFPEASIIHFKGQSTNKLSLLYIRSFYGAMFIFANKYFLKLNK